MPECVFHIRLMHRQSKVCVFICLEFLFWLKFRLGLLNFERAGCLDAFLSVVYESQGFFFEVAKKSISFCNFFHLGFEVFVNLRDGGFNSNVPCCCCWGKLFLVLAQSISERHRRKPAGVDGAPRPSSWGEGELLRGQVVSYSIALWSSIAAFTSWDWP